MSSLPTELQCLAERAQGDSRQVVGGVRHLTYLLCEQGSGNEGGEGVDMAAVSACDELMLQARGLQFDAARMRDLIDDQAEADRELYAMTVQLVDICLMVHTKALKDKPGADGSLICELANGAERLLADMQELLAERFPGESASIGG